MSGTQAVSNSSQQMANLVKQNATARAMIRASAVDCVNLVYTTTYTPSGGGTNVLYITPRPVGLIKGWWLHIKGNINNTGANPIVPTPWNVANVLQNIIFNDIQNYQRINTTGWHLESVNTAKTRRPFGTVFVDTVPIQYGDNFNLIQCPAVIAPGASGLVEMWYWVPAAYNNGDLRGAIYANIVNATMQLQVTLNQTPVVASANDTTQAVFSGAGATGTWGSVTVELWQNYLDQLPTQNGQVVLPQIDLSWIYELKNTVLTGLAVNSMFPVTFSNFRNFYSMTLQYDNGGQLNNGTDVTAIALQSANFTNIYNISPALSKLMWERSLVQTDFPPGTYYLDFRNRPISSVQYGNIQVQFTPSVVNAGAQLNVGFEDLGMANTIIPAGSLPAG